MFVARLLAIEAGDTVLMRMGKTGSGRERMYVP
jgi:hypothetical protein